MPAFMNVVSYSAVAPIILVWGMKYFGLRPIVIYSTLTTILVALYFGVCLSYAVKLASARPKFVPLVGRLSKREISKEQAILGFCLLCLAGLSGLGFFLLPSTGILLSEIANGYLPGLRGLLALGLCFSFTLWMSLELISSIFSKRDN